MISRSERPETFWATLPIKIASSCPRVVIKPVRTPLRSIIALVATVQPWISTSAFAMGTDDSRTAFKAPSAGPLGVDITLHVVILPSSSIAT